MFGIDDIIGVGMKILDKVIPDPTAKAEAQAKLLELQQIILLLLFLGSPLPTATDLNGFTLFLLLQLLK